MIEQVDHLAARHENICIVGSRFTDYKGGQQKMLLTYRWHSHRVNSKEKRNRVPHSLRLLGFKKEVAEMNAQAFSMITDGDAAWLSEDVPLLLDRPARSFEAFATDYASAFS